MLNRKVLGWIALFAPLSAVAYGAPERSPLFEQVSVRPFVILPRPINGSRDRPDVESVLRRLSEEATRQAGRTLLGHRLAGKVERLETPGPRPGGITLVGSVRLPVALPPGVIGLRASSRRGPFAYAQVSLQGASGRPLATGEATLEWDDVRWLRGARVRRNRPLDQVLEHATRKAVDRAVRRLKASDLRGSIMEDEDSAFLPHPSARFEWGRAEVRGHYAGEEAGSPRRRQLEPRSTEKSMKSMEGRVWRSN